GPVADSRPVHRGMRVQAPVGILPGFSPRTRGVHAMLRTCPYATTGPVADMLIDVCGELRTLPDLAAAEYRFPRWIRRLEWAADRPAPVRRRGGSLPRVKPALDWLAATMHEGFWCDPAAEPIRSEVERCIGRIRQCLQGGL